MIDFINEQENEKLHCRCEDCLWVDIFTPRQDEIEAGHTLGCKYPGWEEYIHSESAERRPFFTNKKSDERTKNVPND